MKSKAQARDGSVESPSSKIIEKKQSPNRAASIDKSRWRLLDERGRQRWRYLRDDKQLKEWPQSYADKWYLGIDTGLPDLPIPKTARDAQTNGLTFFEKLQLPPGNWGCEYGGPMFLLPGIVITWYVTNTRIPDEYRAEIQNYLFARQNKIDGGWGLHIEGESSVFGTAMNYTVLRIVGAEADDSRMIKARAMLHKLGGAVQGPHWAKFWLSLLGACEWEAVNPVPPELWLLPDWVPIAPWRWWIHMRQVFLPMSFIWSHRWVFPATDLTRALRNELYIEPYESINFASHRNSISPRDNFHPKTRLLNTVNWGLVNVYNPYLRYNGLKQKAENWVYELIQMEDANTDYACLAPVNAPMNTLARYIREGPDSEAVARHLDRFDDFLWVNDEGMMCNGTNGAQSWDTTFLILAAVEGGVAEDPRWKPMLVKALEFLEDQQILEECERQHECYRQYRKGAWSFSTRDQGYTVSDTTAEGLKATMILQNIPGMPKLISDERMKWAIDTLLTMQNKTGGFPSYEPARGNETILEALNAAEVFGRIMVEYDYPECTTAVLTTLCYFSKFFPDYRAAEIAKAKAGALRYIKHSQRKDGSWYGSWGICFTYAGMFALQSLATAGETYETSEQVRRACKFFIDKQSPLDGGWGESYKSCEDGVWTEHPDGSQVVQTAWALIALMEAGYPDLVPLRRGIQLIMSRQKPNGEWAQEGIEGVFNKSCMISYPNYKFTFPIKALGMYAARSNNEVLV